MFYYEAFEKLKKYILRDCVDKVQCEMLMLNSCQDQVAGSYEQSKTIQQGQTNAI